MRLPFRMTGSSSTVRASAHLSFSNSPHRVPTSLPQSPARSVASSSTSTAAPPRTLSFHPRPISPRPHALKSPRVSRSRTSTCMRVPFGRRRTCCPSASRSILVINRFTEGCVVKVSWTSGQRGEDSGARRGARWAFARSMPRGIFGNLVFTLILGYERILSKSKYLAGDVCASSLVLS